MWQILLICIAAAAAVQPTDISEEVLYHIPGLGDVKGTLIKNPARDTNVDVRQFTGIPFAQPPVGDLRFAVPKPVKPWQPVVINATKSSPSCMQTPYHMNEDWNLFKDSAIQEDCLYLNIWVPERDNTEELFSVMVWIHGGGFATGSISTKGLTGDVLAAAGNVIVVSVNYRFGAFGFAHLANPKLDGKPAIPGNLGFLDQQLGLRWVKDHIQNFGGDPENMTVFGESAGGASVTAQLAAPGSADLFTRAIAQSGSIRDPWALRSSSFLTNKTAQLAAKLGCPTDSNDAAAVLRCMRAVPAAAVLNTTVAYTMLPLDDDSCFFHGSAYDRLNSVDLSNKSIMMGNTFDEYRLFMLLFHSHRFTPAVKWDLDRAGYIQLATGVITYSTGEVEIDPILHGGLLWHYDNSSAFGDNYVDKFARLGTDATFVCGERRVQQDWLRGERQHNLPKDLYLYLYNQSISTPDGLGVQQLRASHGSDIGPTFGSALRRRPRVKGTYDNATDSYIMPDGSVLTDITELYMDTVNIVRFWTNFAKLGNPNGDGAGESVNENSIWEPATDPQNLVVRVLQGDDKYSRMIPDPNKEDCAFWEEVIEANERLHKEA